MYIRPHFNRKPARKIIELQLSIFPSPKGGSQVNKTNQTTNEWKIYRTRFLVRATQLSEPLTFTDTLGREHRGEPGDCLVESSDGTTRVAPRAIFEDIYVVMPSAYQNRKSARNSPMALTRKGTHALARPRSDSRFGCPTLPVLRSFDSLWKMRMTWRIRPVNCLRYKM